LNAVAEGRVFPELRAAKRPMIILGSAALARDDGPAVYAAALKIAQSTGMFRSAEGNEPAWNGFNVLHSAAARVGGLDVGFVPAPGGRDTSSVLTGTQVGSIDAVFLLGADEIDPAKLGKAFKIYIGSHGDRGANAADVILPAAAYTEKDGTYVNTEGRVQLGERAVFPPGEAKEDWAIFRALSAVLGKTLPFDSLTELRAKMYAAVPHLAEIDKLPTPGPIAPNDAGLVGALGSAALTAPSADFYLTNPIARASAIMAECSSMFSRPRAMAAE